MALAQLASHAASDETFFVWLGEGLACEREVTFAQLWTTAGDLAATMLLGELRLAAGDRALCCYAPGPEFYFAFWACLRASVVAVPVYPPDPSKMQKALDKLALVQSSCGARVCLTDATVDLLRQTTGLFYSWPDGLAWHSTGGRARGAPTTATTALLDGATADDLAFLQFTSGSTGIVAASGIDGGDASRRHRGAEAEHHTR